ncbi:MAG TPA: glucose-6-phosphate dehydrogenase [Candidatus Eisenbacteria bacterium]|nr:glucose-6-phosphate dehydrogenase [Candidatus Eisenbacteria bacterium]
MDSPFVFILFGATGDLAKNKLIPALFTLFTKKELPQDFFIFGFSRREMTDEEFGEFFPEVSAHPAWQDFATHLHYQQGLFDEEKGYIELVEKLKSCDEKLGACITRIFYLAKPPSNYDAILQNLINTKLSEGCGQGSSKWTRIAIEKPFGKDLATAKALDSTLATIFEERQIFRVDHYLGKETIQNLLVFRFANGIFDPIWNKEYIDHVQITWSEEKGVGTRGSFFDGVGLLRDTAQNHLMQLYAAIAMEMPKSFSKEGVRDVRAAAIKDIIPIEPEQVGERVVRGQYDGYREEKNVDPNSSTETFVALKFFVNSERFRDVPFYMRAGKKLAKSETTISLVFRQTCHILFKEIGCPEDGNVLTIRIQPNEGISLRIIAKTPGSHLALQPTEMHFNYKEQFGTQGTGAYEKVLTDIITGDQMLFNRSDELEASWTFIEKITKGWENSESKIITYEQESNGPKEADELIEKDGKKWIE